MALPNSTLPKFQPINSHLSTLPKFQPINSHLSTLPNFQPINSHLSTLLKFQSINSNLLTLTKFQPINCLSTEDNFSLQCTMKTHYMSSQWFDLAMQTIYHHCQLVYTLCRIHLYKTNQVN